jgi:hypothetical protein
MDCPQRFKEDIDMTFPLTGPYWDYNTNGGKEKLLRAYCQILMEDLQEAARWPTNLSKVRQVTQGKDECPRDFLERFVEAYRTYSPFHPEARESQSAVNMDLLNCQPLTFHEHFNSWRGLKLAIDRAGSHSRESLQQQRDS